MEQNDTLNEKVNEQKPEIQLIGKKHLRKILEMPE